MKRVLLVVEERLVVNALQHLLEDDGFEIVTYDLPSAQLDAVIVDMDLPDSRGWKAVRVARSVRPGIPVVGITRYGNSAKWSTAETGPISVVDKPVQVDVLSKALADLTGGARR